LFFGINVTVFNEAVNKNVNTAAPAANHIVDVFNESIKYEKSFVVK